MGVGDTEKTDPYGLNTKPYSSTPPGYSSTTSPQKSSTTSDNLFGSPTSRQRRRSSLFKLNPIDEAKEEELAEDIDAFYCRSTPLNPILQASITPLGAHRGLQQAIAESNEDLDFALQDYVNQENDKANAEVVNSGTAVNYKFEELRARIAAATKEYDATRQIANDARIEADRLTSELRKVQQENATLSSALILAQKKIKDQALINTTTDLFGDLNIVDITVPKQYKAQLEANKPQVYEGSSDVETTYKFLKTLNHHTRILRTFNDAQKVEYALSYMAGSNRPPSARKWDEFLTDFKAQWVPENADVLLTNKLEKMEMKAIEIDTFNDGFRGTLELMDYDQLDELKEADQYYRIYLRKIKDQAIRESLQRMALTTKGGLSFEDLMRLTSRLFHQKPQSTTASTSTPASKPAHIAEETDANATIATKGGSRGGYAGRGRGGGSAGRGGGQQGGRDYIPRACYLCGETDHVLADCQLKKQVLEMAKQMSKDAGTGKA
ncbi:hypothetical protein BJ508DRAFT_336331 [Ascobolus immersus RN42]|uniref:Ty3 transposon capsid-like protein domain-containing protein n=1 Tax=Ascobolus immersus RN42 TaxID=1160509 RepID=A0A3N4HD21_ASCIM|nr:hypothetical protein BJ508DRAFT_336331 [Ascobolus immersus RN42]